MHNNNWKFFFLLMLLVFSGATFVLGIFVGYENRPEILKVISLANKEAAVVSTESTLVDFSPFWKSWNIIDEKFVGVATTTGEQERVWGAIKGLIESLEDPYSVFFPPADAETFAENIAGNFGGVGMEIGMRNNILTVIAPIKNTPAEKAGIKAGDRIIFIDETPTSDLNIEEAVRLIRGPVGTSVEISIERDNVQDLIEISVERAVISIPTIDTEERTDGIFVIKLYNFSGTSPQLFREALREFVLSGKDKLLIDVRGNVGGFLEAAVDITSWFLPPGKIIVTEDFGGKTENTVYRSRGYDIFNENLKLVILVDKGSASATEIFAGALSEHGIATLVGEKTFGKGSVQELINITSDTSLKITVAHWLTPKGNSISKNGIVPDVEILITQKDIDSKKDPQLEKAVEILNNIRR
ncbi:MAG: S41 family peptidase [Parcubacteria group bacterium]|nr:S41 family peptidase [Parcubacteria group bacterium]